MKTKILIIALLVTALAMSCDMIFDCVDGNGIMKTEERDASSFTAISNETSFHVIYRKGEEASITVEAESNILPYIETNISRGALEICRTKGCGCIRYNTQPVITVTSPFLSEVVNAGSGDIVAADLEGEEVQVIITGSGNVTTDLIGCTEAVLSISGSGGLATGDINANSVKATITGSGDMTISGETTTARYALSGSGMLHSDDLETVDTKATVSGSGSIYTTVLESLEATLSGSGNIYLYGDPEISLTRTGSGRIINLH